MPCECGQSWISTSRREHACDPGLTSIWAHILWPSVSSRSEKTPDDWPTHGFMYGNLFPGSSWCLYIYSPSVAAGRRRQSAALSVFHHDPNSPSSFKVTPGPSSAGVILLSGAGRGPGDGFGAGIRLLGSADWSHADLCSGGQKGSVYPVCMFGTRYIPFREWE